MTVSHRYRRVCVLPGERHAVIGPDEKIVGFLRASDEYGWDWRLWRHDWNCEGMSLAEAYEQVVQVHGDLVRARTEGAG